jgi:hypothetical protein
VTDKSFAGRGAPKLDLALEADIQIPVIGCSMMPFEVPDLVDNG